jgi:hypothetical protein
MGRNRVQRRPPHRPGGAEAMQQDQQIGTHASFLGIEHSMTPQRV